MTIMIMIDDAFIYADQIPYKIISFYYILSCFEHSVDTFKATIIQPFFEAKKT